MFKFISAKGEILSLTNDEYFTLTDFDGMTESNVNVLATNMSNADGDIINSQFVNPRDVTITLRVKDGVNPEQAKRHILNYVKPKLAGIIEVNYESRRSRLTGVVTNVTMPRFTNKVIFQFTLHCSNPFWEDVSMMESRIGTVLPLHHFEIYSVFDTEPIVFGEITEKHTAEIFNDGDIEIGMNLTIRAVDGEVVNPTIVKGSEKFKVYTTLKAEDELTISTVKGNKFVRLNGKSILKDIDESSIWIQLSIGSNEIAITADSGEECILSEMTSKKRYI